MEELSSSEERSAGGRGGKGLAGQSAGGGEDGLIGREDGMEGGSDVGSEFDVGGVAWYRRKDWVRVVDWWWGDEMEGRSNAVLDVLEEDGSRTGVWIVEASAAVDVELTLGALMSGRPLVNHVSWGANALGESPHRNWETGALHLDGRFFCVWKGWRGWEAGAPFHALCCLWA